MSDTIALTFLESDIAVLRFDAPDRGANVLSQSVFEELKSHLDALESRKDLAGLVICSGKGGIFVAGADVREFAANIGISSAESEAMASHGQALLRRLSQMPFVTVAAIQGVCLGGGAELAIWCDRRIVANDERTQIGFPEVKLGLFPGWGGTVRTPRLVGISNAVEIITSGRSVSAQEAVSMGLADLWVAPEDLEAAAVRVVRQEQASRKFVDDRRCLEQPIEISETELGFLGATASAMIRAETKGQYPAPVAALEVLLEGAMLDAPTALAREAQAMGQLFGSEVNASLLNVFFLTDRNKKDPGVDSDIKPTKLERVGVVGAGIMGAGIAAANLKRGVQVLLADASAKSLYGGLQNALDDAAYDRATKGPSLAKMKQQAPLINALSSQEDWSSCDLVIEAIVENEEIKRKILAEIEGHLPETAILASNTSTIPITKLAQSLKRPDRFCGIHFFNPVRKMQLVEVIRGEMTSDETVAQAVAHAKRLGKMPIVLKDGPGFLVNRLLLPYMNEAIELLLDGVSISDVERAAKAFGMPMGPITLYDVVGLDTALFAGQVLWEAFPDRIVMSPLLSSLVEAGRLGQKSGRGFFKYETKKRKAQPDPAFDELIQPLLREKREYNRDEITKRLFLPMLLEATRVLQEGLVRDVRDVDLGLIFGIGFPPFRGGLLFWADRLGAANIVEQLKELEYVGARVQPTPLLLEMAADDKKFYADRFAD